ncbi:hypothetical protein MMC26_000487 [Xylographa opegraphella]|nr:hypothetical protein [Xylographa opegraphella]
MALAKIPPMTSRQAKKAYRQASGPRLSVAEQKRMERKAVLLEREEKAKEKERNRVANRKKRLEKEEKVKAQRKGAGVVEGGYVSPRQVRLAAYFGKIEGQDGEGDCGKGQGSFFKDCGLPRLCVEEGVAGGGTQDIALEMPSYPPPEELNFSDNDWASFLPTNTQVEREISEDNPTAQALPARADTDPLGCSHSEPLGSHKTIAPACELQSTTSQQQEDLAQIPPFSTQDLEFSADELIELMSPAKFCNPLPAALGKTASAKPLTHSPTANEQPAATSHPHHKTATKANAIVQNTPPHKPCHPTITSNAPGPAPRKRHSCTYSYILTSHAAHPTPSRTAKPGPSSPHRPKSLFRTQQRKPLAVSSANVARAGKLAAETRCEEEVAGAGAGAQFDFGDEVLSTQELLELVG